MRILQINSSDSGGGSQAISRKLHEAFLEKGHDSHLLVGRKQSDIPNVHSLLRHPRLFGKPKLSYLHHLERLTGLQGFFSPYLARWTKQHPPSWDVIHCHNLHGAGYVSLRELEKFNPDTEMVLTLHDLWMCTGHCVHPQQCNRFKQGCGKCPDLERWVPICIDHTRGNAARKKKFLHRRKPTLVGVSKWVGEQVDKSHLNYPCRTIYNGIDLAKFRPMPQAEARERLHLPADCVILLYVVAGGLQRGQGNDFKRPAQVIEACRILKKRKDFPNFRLVTVGGKGTVPTDIADIVIQTGKIDAGIEVYFAASDVTLHASAAETFGLVLAESLACGTPVITTDAGGCPEVVKDSITGHVVPLEDPQAMANATDRTLNSHIGEMRMQARKDTLARFSQKRMVDDYVSLYEELTAKRVE